MIKFNSPVTSHIALRSKSTTKGIVENRQLAGERNRLLMWLLCLLCFTCDRLRPVIGKKKKKKCFIIEYKVLSELQKLFMSIKCSLIYGKISASKNHLIGTTDLMKRFNALLFDANNRLRGKKHIIDEPNIKKHFSMIENFSIKCPNKFHGRSRTPRVRKQSAEKEE